MRPNGRWFARSVWRTLPAWVVRLIISPSQGVSVRMSTIVGIVLIAVGAFLFYRGGSFTTNREVLKVGDLKVTAQERQPIEPWVAGAAVVGGLVLVASGMRRKA